MPIPFWSIENQIFVYKQRPVLIYNLLGVNAIILPITSNDNEDGSMKRKANKFEVEIKLNKFGLINCTNLFTINQDAITKNIGKGYTLPTNKQRIVELIIMKYVILKTQRSI